MAILFSRYYTQGSHPYSYTTYKLFVVYALEDSEMDPVPSQMYWFPFPVTLSFEIFTLFDIRLA